MDGWNIALLVLAGYVAVSQLVRLMLARRNKLVAELREQAAAEQRKIQQEKRRREEDEEAA